MTAQNHRTTLTEHATDSFVLSIGKMSKLGDWAIPTCCKKGGILKKTEVT
jgi:hypothetical protein